MIFQKSIVVGTVQFTDDKISWLDKFIIYKENKLKLKLKTTDTRFLFYKGVIGKWKWCKKDDLHVGFINDLYSDNDSNKLINTKRND